MAWLSGKTHFRNALYSSACPLDLRRDTLAHQTDRFRPVSVQGKLREGTETPRETHDALLSFYFKKINGGERGIRTLGTLARSTVFETAPIDHSGTSPRGSGVVTEQADKIKGAMR
jgi:hypothetical protein